MTQIILETKNDKEAKFLLEMAQRMNIRGRKISVSFDDEDADLLRAIEKGETGKYVNTKSFVAKLRKK